MLKRASGGISAPFSLAFLTDRRRLPNPEPVMRALPAGAAVIYRDYDDPRRTAIGRRYRAICAARNILFLVAGDAALARLVGADGLHLPARAMRRGAGPGVTRVGLLTIACHDAAELACAGEIGADLALLSPVFATQSHPGADYLGAAAFRELAAASPLPVLALGGVDGKNARLVAGKNVAGIAAIGAFTD